MGLKHCIDNIKNAIVIIIIINESVYIKFYYIYIKYLFIELENQEALGVNKYS